MQKKNNNKIKKIIIIKYSNNKIKIYININGFCVYSLTPGIIFKKLQIESKNIKKSEKMVNLMLKSITTYIIEKKYKSDFIINLEGSNSKNYKIFLFLSKFLKKYLKKSNLNIVFTPKLIVNGTKFKKIKSIKRKLVKKFTKKMIKKSSISGIN